MVFKRVRSHITYICERYIYKGVDIPNKKQLLCWFSSMNSQNQLRRDSYGIPTVYRKTGLLNLSRPSLSRCYIRKTYMRSVQKKNLYFFLSSFCMLCHLNEILVKSQSTEIVTPIEKAQPYKKRNCLHTKFPFKISRNDKIKSTGGEGVTNKLIQ